MTAPLTAQRKTDVQTVSAWTASGPGSEYATFSPAWLLARFLKRLLPSVALAALTVLTAACTSFLALGPAPSRMQLIPAMPGQITNKPLNKQIIVSTPVAGSDIDSDSIALVFNNREVHYLSGVRWSSPVPDIIQRSLIDALAATNALRGVADERAGIMADARLLCDIRQFSLHYDVPEGIPTAVAAAHFRLINLFNGSIMGMRSVSVTVPAGGRDDRALAAACEAALSRFLAEVAPWVAQTLASVR